MVRLLCLFICGGSTPLAGQVLWETTVGLPGNQLQAITLAPSEGPYFLAAGYRSDTLSGDLDLWVAELDTNGVARWESQITHPRGGQFKGFAIHRTPNRVLTTASHLKHGLSLLQFSPTGEHLSTWDFPELLRTTPVVITPGPEGHIYLGGYQISDGRERFWVGAISPEGTLLWQRTFGNGGGNRPGCRALALTVAGQLFAAGRVDNRAALYRFDTDGTFEWGTALSSPTNGGVRSMRISSGGCLLVGGWVSGNNESRAAFWQVDTSGSVDTPLNLPTGRVETVTQLSNGRIELNVLSRNGRRRMELTPTGQAVLRIEDRPYHTPTSIIFRPHVFVEVPGAGYVQSPYSHRASARTPPLLLRFYPRGGGASTLSRGQHVYYPNERSTDLISDETGCLLLCTRQYRSTRSDIVGYWLTPRGTLRDSFRLALPGDQQATKGVRTARGYHLVSLSYRFDSIDYELHTLNDRGQYLHSCIVLSTEKQHSNLLANYQTFSLRELSDGQLLLHTPNHLLLLNSEGDIVKHLQVPGNLPPENKETVLALPDGGWLLAKLTPDRAVRLWAYDSEGTIRRERTVVPAQARNPLIQFVVARQDDKLVVLIQPTAGAVPETYWLSSSTLQAIPSPWQLQEPLETRHPSFGEGGWGLRALFTDRLWLIDESHPILQIGADGQVRIRFERNRLVGHEQNIEGFYPSSNDAYFTTRHRSHHHQFDVVVRQYGPEDQRASATTVADAAPLLLYPNPADRQLNLALDLPVSGSFVLEVFDAAGQRIYRRSLDKNAPLLHHQLAVHPYPPGTYYLHLRGGGYALTRAFEVF